jgi:hypothetical protein
VVPLITVITVISDDDDEDNEVLPISTRAPQAAQQRASQEVESTNDEPGGELLHQFVRYGITLQEHWLNANSGVGWLWRSSVLRQQLQ